MDSVSVRDLRNQGGTVLERVGHGASLLVTRDGTPVAELRPHRGARVSTAQLIARRRTLPYVDPVALRDDVDARLDPAL